MLFWKRESHKMSTEKIRSDSVSGSYTWKEGKEHKI